MSPQSLPVPLIRWGLNVLPPHAVSRILDVLVRRMKRRHPQLFKNLARLDKAVVHLELTDAPQTFVLTVGVPEPMMTLLEGKGKKPDACIAAPLAVFLDMLEGRVDGDTLFFARGLAVNGDVSLAVALRNTIDREKINLLDDLTSALGPFALPAKLAAGLIDSLAHRAGAGDKKA